MNSLCITAHAAIFPAFGEAHADTAALADFENPRGLRRVSHFCRLGLLAAHRCLHNAPAPPGSGLAGLTSPAGLGLVIATGYGPIRTSFDYLDSMLDFGPHLASPTAFSTSVHNIAASSISLHLGLTGPVHTVSQGETSLIAALDIAALWLANGQANAVLLGALDEYDPDLNAMLAAEQTASPARAIPRPRPVEGALFVLLTAADSACATRSAYPALRDWGMGSGQLSPDAAPANSLWRQEGETPPACRHPAGPVHALAAALANTGDTIRNTRATSGNEQGDLRISVMSPVLADIRPALCVSNGLDGTYSALTLYPPFCG